jgi:hypothetical protein
MFPQQINIPPVFRPMAIWHSLATKAIVTAGSHTQDNVLHSSKRLLHINNWNDIHCIILPIPETSSMRAGKHPPNHTSDADQIR